MSSDGGPALRVEELSKTFGSGEDAVRAVEDVSFSVAPGSVVGLLGPNGAGKTTTIKSMLGLVVPDTGRVEVGGIDVHDDPGGAYDRVGAMLEGARNVYWRLTVRENLAFFAGLGGRDPDELRDRHDRLLEVLDLADRADTPVNELSRGMKQKVSLASTLARDVDVVFLDEPTLGLDVETSLDLRAELRRLADREDLAVVLSSHDMDVVEAVCDRVIVLQDGRIVADDDVDGLVDLFRTRRYRIRVGAPVGAEARRRFEREFDAEWRSRGGDPWLAVTVRDGNRLYDLVDALREEGVELRDVDSVDPGLEEVFLRLTGGDGGAGDSGEDGHEGASPGDTGREVSSRGDT